MKAEILSVGTELLLGDIINTDAAYIARALSSLGISLYHQTVVGDNRERLKEAAKTALERSDILFTTGGLGPTYDDITKQVIAELLDVKLILDLEAYGDLCDYFKKKGRQMTDNNKIQAMRPIEGFFFKNDHGTAPGLCINVKNKTVIMLPGPPRELEPMVDNYVVPYLMKLSKTRILSKNINYFGIGESSLEQMIRSEIEKDVNPSVAPYCGNGEVRLRVTASAESEEAAERMIDEKIKHLLELTGEYSYGVDAVSLENKLVSELKKYNMTVTTAESCTGGRVASRITSVSGASEVFERAFVTYCDKAKREELGVKKSTLEKYTAVSEQTAKEMAEGARKRSNADISLAVTGYAGPNGGTERSPVGTVFISVATEGETITKRLDLSGHTRDYVCHLATSNLLHLALKTVQQVQKYKEK